MVSARESTRTVQRIATIDAEVLDRQRLRELPELASLWQILDEVKDPEIPALSIWDLGVLRSVQRSEDTITVVITPTYSGCPAMRAIKDDIVAMLARHGQKKVTVETRLAPAWTSDWMSAAGRTKLNDYGIAPPVGLAADHELTPGIDCPLCGSSSTRRISEFGSTACKALYQCEDCREPFDYFKCI